MLVRDEQESGTQVSSCRFTVSMDIVRGESFGLHAGIMIARDDVNRHTALPVTQRLELAVVLNVLVEEIARDDQLVDIQCYKTIQDVCQRVKTPWLILPRGQVNARCYRDLQGSMMILLGHRLSRPEFMEL